ncbi:uncharacterized protein G2W53_004283 [Senna tora]|uniref:Uncharacterized protein n=1 Tax=Senna tora TaxID=362788 RepID=A0A834XCH4_9FABA|nr:uncharacterized protein G2W53_004283 [Senna tora]
MELRASAMAGVFNLDFAVFKQASWRENVESMFLNTPMPSIAKNIGYNSRILHRSI